MKLISWNVNGIRAVMKKGFTDVLDELDADFVCIQETKAHPEQIESYTDNYPYMYINSAKRKGYSGTMILCKKEPLSIKYGMNIPEFDDEGRIITLEYPEFYLVTVYTPTSGDGLMRLDYRLEWDKAFGDYVNTLDKPVMVCGDFNVANDEIDVPYPDMMRGTAGFSDEERDSFKENLLSSLVDTYRALHPETVQYSWWSYRGQARQNNIGMRLDYWLVSPELKSKVKDSSILTDILGSDHCPIMLDIDL